MAEVGAEELRDAIWKALSLQPELANTGPKALLAVLKHKDERFTSVSAHKCKRELQLVLDSIAAELKESVHGGQAETESQNTMGYVGSEPGKRKNGVRIGDSTMFSGSMHFLGNACLPPGSKFNFRKNPQSGMHKRQLSASRTFVEKFSLLADSTPLEREALRLNHYCNEGRARGKLAALSIQENALLVSHSFVVSALPSPLMRRCVQLSHKIREGMQTGYDGNPIAFPNTELLFNKLDCPSCHRVDALLLIEKTLNVCAFDTVIGYSEPDAEVIVVHRGFETSRDAHPESGAEALKCIKGSFLRCYWCRKSAESVEPKMLMCGTCKQLDYCSKLCQLQDWDAFHRHECKHLQGSTKEAFGLGATRQEELGKSGKLVPSYPLPLGGGIWKDDELKVIFCNVDMATGTLSDKSTVFPHGGFKFTPREVLSAR